MTRRGIVATAVGAVVLCIAGLAMAHWCSNIFVSRARFVVKPEKTTVYVGSQPVQFRVYLQNNFPYKLFDVRMRGVASGYSFSVSPTQQDIHPGQNVSFMFTVQRTSAAAGNMNANAALQMDFRLGSWRDTGDNLVAQNPSQSTLVNMSQYGGAGSQTGSVNAGVLSDLFPNAQLSSGAPSFGRTGMQQNIHWFGYRYCYNTGGSWRCPSQECPSPCAEGSAWTSIQQFPQNCMRAGAEVAARKTKLGSDLTAARNAATNAVSTGPASCTPSSSNTCAGDHRCLAAVVGGYLWKGASNTTAFQNALNALPSYLSECKDAGLRALGTTTSALNCSSSTYYKRAACAAAEGLNNNNGPVISILMPNAGDGDSSGSYNSLYYAYMLYIVQAYRKASTGHVPFYPDAGTPVLADAAVVPPDTQPWPTPDTSPTPDTQPWPTPDTSPTPDTTPWPTPDTAPWPTPDKGPQLDTVPWPTPDQNVTDGPTVDTSITDGPKPADDGPLVPSESGTDNPNGKTLDGGCGCEVGVEGNLSALSLLVLFALFAIHRRRQSL